jgi:organic radical activating enzyme
MVHEEAPMPLNEFGAQAVHEDADALEKVPAVHVVFTGGEPVHADPAGHSAQAQFSTY